ncbi:MAG: hypothetical protein ACFE88_15880 [Candidatus Hermodarchaeota archaeon]
MAKKYSKEEVFEIFQSKDIDLMRSLINKEFVKDLEFSEQEKRELVRNLNVLLVELIDEPDDFHGYNFKPLYYNLFGDEYVKALLELVGVEFKGFEYHYMWIWNLNKYSMPILRAKIHGSLTELEFNNENEFCLIVITIGTYFGSRELLHYLDNTNHFKLLYNVPTLEHKEVNYLLEVTLFQVIYAILEHIESSNLDDKSAAEKLHQKFTELFKYYFMEEKRIDHAEIIYSLLNYLNKRNELSLISSVINSIPQNILNEFFNNPQMLNLNEFIKKVLR